MPPITNPFNDSSAPTINPYTAQEIATLQSRLDKKLGPEYISARPGASGSKVYYLAADKCITLANEVFGFNGWSSSVQNIQVDFVDENAQSGRISLGLSVTLRITLRDGTFHEDVGYGHIENCKGKAAAFEKAKKEGTTDALKRTMRNFGNVLGNCLYDKDFLSKVTKIKVVPTKWDIEDLHRHADYIPSKREPTIVKEEPPQKAADSRSVVSEAEFEDDFDGDLFNDADFAENGNNHTDETAVEQHTPVRPTNGTATKGINTAPSNAASNEAFTANRRPLPRTASAPSKALHSTKSMPPPPQGPQPNINNNSSSPGQPSAHFQPRPPDPLPHPLSHGQSPAPNPGPAPPTAGFYSARSVSTATTTSPSTTNSTNSTTLDLPPQPAPGAHFNIHAESPSIRKTAGFDHRKSAPIPRKIFSSTTNGNTTATSSTTTNTDPPLPSVPLPGHAAALGRDFINPAADPNRKIGVPGAGFGGGGGGGQYRPPAKRPLADATNVPGPPRVGVGPEKKFKADG
ncbi:MAG: hypothetical protein Q9160_004465 [Pyrenula sp. 1 TL-2023]